MSGSFMPFCVLVLMITSTVLVNMGGKLNHEAGIVLKFTQALALIGAVSEPLIEFFDGSVTKGLATAFFFGIICLVLTTTNILRGSILPSRNR